MIGYFVGDEFEPIKEAFAKMTPKINSPTKPQVSPQKQKSVSVLDFFGVAAVRQEERKMVATKRKSVRHDGLSQSV